MPEDANPTTSLTGPRIFYVIFFCKERQGHARVGDVGQISLQMRIWATLSTFELSGGWRVTIELFLVLPGNSRAWWYVWHPGEQGHRSGSRGPLTVTTCSVTRWVQKNPLAPPLGNYNTFPTGWLPPVPTKCEGGRHLSLPRWNILRWHLSAGISPWSPDHHVPGRN